MGQRLEGAWLLVAAVWGGCAGLANLAALEQGLNCNARQYQQGDWCCSRCSPGQKVGAECSGASGDTLCVPCESQHFQPSWTKEKYCSPHRECSENAGLVVYAPGTDTRDAECRCRNGTHCSSNECHTCRENKLCGPGWGVQRAATHEHDTICVECPEGSFSSISSATAPCQPWSSCEDQNLVQKARGTSVSDVVCAPVPPDSPPPPSLPSPHIGSQRMHLLALLPLAALLLVGGFFVLWRCQKHKGRQKPQPQPPNEAEEEEEPEEYSALPIQEQGGQPVALEDGKETRLAVQEQV